MYYKAPASQGNALLIFHLPPRVICRRSWRMKVKKFRNFWNHLDVSVSAYQFILSTIMAEDNQDIGHTLPLHNLLQPSLDIFHTDKGGIPILALGVCELNLLWEVELRSWVEVLTEKTLSILCDDIWPDLLYCAVMTEGGFWDDWTYLSLCLMTAYCSPPPT